MSTDTLTSALAAETNTAQVPTAGAVEYVSLNGLSLVHKQYEPG